MMVNMKKIIDKLALIIIIMGFIEISTITFLMSANVNTDKYFKKFTSSDKEDNICKI